MKTLIIKDLARTEELNSAAMADVRGGWSMNSPYYKFGDVNIGGTYDSSIKGVQNLGQQQQDLVATANGSAFLDGIHVHSNTAQNGANTIVG
ncbi:hypothetical protein AB4Z19_07610 [Pseudoduganella sp. RAF19]|jgi:hypothetical protein|uniref:hypothetical protein n=1 Tax=Pseudoduganella sp. RAF19 TaxID=3233052 RepID=UPI003F9E7CE5